MQNHKQCFHQRWSFSTAVHMRFTSHHRSHCLLLSTKTPHRDITIVHPPTRHRLLPGCSPSSKYSALLLLLYRLLPLPLHHQPTLSPLTLHLQTPQTRSQRSRRHHAVRCVMCYRITAPYPAWQVRSVTISASIKRRFIIPTQLPRTCTITAWKGRLTTAAKNYKI